MASQYGVGPGDRYGVYRTFGLTRQPRSGSWGFSRVAKSLTRIPGLRQAITSPVPIWVNIPGTVGAAGEVVWRHPVPDPLDPVKQDPYKDRMQWPKARNPITQYQKAFADRLSNVAEDVAHILTDPVFIDPELLGMLNPVSHLLDDLQSAARLGNLDPVSAFRTLGDEVKGVLRYLGSFDVDAPFISAVVAYEVSLATWLLGKIRSTGRKELYRNMNGWVQTSSGCVGTVEEFFKGFNPGDPICFDPGPGGATGGFGWNIGDNNDDADVTGLSGMSSWMVATGRTVGNPFGWAWMTAGYERQGDPLVNVKPGPGYLPEEDFGPGLPNVIRGPGATAPKPRPESSDLYTRNRTAPNYGKEKRREVHVKLRGAGAAASAGRAIGYNFTTEFGDVVDALWANIPTGIRDAYGDPSMTRKLLDIYNHAGDIQWSPFVDLVVHRPRDGQYIQGRLKGGALWDLGVNAIEDLVYGSIGMATAKGAVKLRQPVDLAGRAIAKVRAGTTELGGYDPITYLLNHVQGYQ